jgi:anti-sigma regulatory factor (Ser/Thr protein kinase)
VIGQYPVAVPDAQPVRLSLPALSKHVRLARLTAAGLATDAGFDVDGVEDLRVAVNELFALLVDDAEDSHATVELTFTSDDGHLLVEGVRAGAGPTEGPEDLALEILRVVVDDHSFVVTDGDRRFSLRKDAAAR